MLVQVKSHTLFADHLTWIVTSAQSTLPRSNMPDRMFLFFFVFKVSDAEFSLRRSQMHCYSVDLFFWKTTCGDKQTSILSFMQIKIVISVGQK